MREPTQFVRFLASVRILKPLILNGMKVRQVGTKNADKRAGFPREVTFRGGQTKMKPLTQPRGPIEVKEFTINPKPISVTPMEMQPTFTLTFSLGTPMRDIHDTVIRTVLQYTRGNRLRAAQLLQINPRTIRRRLGKKESASAARAA
jgi:DNA-binding NtrC family response regulator